MYCSTLPLAALPVRGSTFSDIVQRAGGINLGDEALDGPFGEISLEKIVELNPDVIITDEFSTGRQCRVAGKLQQPSRFGERERQEERPDIHRACPPHIHAFALYR